MKKLVLIGIATISFMAHAGQIVSEKVSFKVSEEHLEDCLSQIYSGGWGRHASTKCRIPLRETNHLERVFHSDSVKFTYDYSSIWAAVDVYISAKKSGLFVSTVFRRLPGGSRNEPIGFWIRNEAVRKAFEHYNGKELSVIVQKYLD